MLMGNAQAEAQAKYQQRQMELQKLIEQRKRDQEERKMRDLLKKEQASARARFGAMGMNSGGGSARAVLDGMQKKFSRDLAEMNEMYDLQDYAEQSQAAFQSEIDLLGEQQNNFGKLMSYASSVAGGLQGTKPAYPDFIGP
ncbi:MAG: hypothetical protein HQL36_07890 [Alphaproteobacteria bacterium]|nr:hypothetical protein [Alphaproteobacteria bacterium]MBF0251241.1 hypothetical protein [Alphaproteobacteria bacterium]